MKRCVTEGCDNPRRIRNNGSYTSRYCNACEKARANGYPIYHVYKKDKCEECGFEPLFSCQLDVDHIDGNKMNGDPSNLRTLCANCHRLKTHLSGDSIPLKQGGD
jgi:hypothetical protein